MLKKYTLRLNILKHIAKKTMIVFTGIIAIGTLWTATAFSAPVTVDWNPSVNPYGANQPWNVPYPARSTDSLLLNGGVLDTVGIVNDSLNHGWGAFTFTNIPDAFNENYYLTFSLLPSAGYQASVSSLLLATDWTQTVGDYVLRTSQDGFVNDILGYNWFGPNTQGYRGIGFDLNALSAFSSETTFRLYISDSFQNDGTSLLYGSVHTLGRGLFFNEVNVTPYVAPPGGGANIPEPGMFFLMGIGLLGIRYSRRKKIFKSFN